MQLIPYYYALLIWYLIFYYIMSFKDNIQKSTDEKIFGVPAWYRIYNDDSENPWKVLSINYNQIHIWFYIFLSNFIKKIK